jgi:hypothetical protein
MRPEILSEEDMEIEYANRCMEIIGSILENKDRLRFFGICTELDKIIEEKIAMEKAEKMEDLGEFD